jgi:S-methylmethionine-dependent homocysteine/selenocysteine methylase
MRILDGAMGTELMARGLALESPSWSARAIEDAPEVVSAVHRAYALAGATVHTANTFRTKRRSVGARWEALARRAVAIARGAVPVDHLVAGSIAPLEDCWRPDLSPPREVARAEHRELARALAEAGVDVMLCETFANEAEAIVAVEEAARTGVETWLALTAGPDGSLMTADAMERAACACVAAGARVVLVNCVAARETLAYVERIAKAGAPFGVYANAFGADGVSPDEYARLARTWFAAGASVVGGCCGTTPAHVAALTNA